MRKAVVTGLGIVSPLGCEVDGFWQFTIDAIPNDDAPVVWGKEELLLREDNVLLRQTFYDQDMVPLKELRTLEIGELGGRTFGVRMRMIPLDEEDHYTELRYEAAEFDLPLEDRLFRTEVVIGEPA